MAVTHVLFRPIPVNELVRCTDGGAHGPRHLAPDPGRT